MTSLEDLFSSLQGRRVLFVRPGGNWGDHLIYLGAEVLAKRRALEFSTVDYEDFADTDYPAFDAAYLHGNGGFNPWTSGRALKAFVRAVERYAGPIIQGPQTTTCDENYVRELAGILNNVGTDKDVYFFARENTTYNNLRKALSRDAGARLCLDQDTALYLTADDLSPHFKHTHRRYKLDAFREDNEQTGLESSFRSDASQVILDPAIYATSFAHWIRIHAASREIRTNRTHSAIAGSILGIKTTMFPSSSHKNRSIWEYSLDSRGVVWAGPITIRDPSDGRMNNADTEPRSQRITGRPAAIETIKRAVRPVYRIINLPRLRAKVGQDVGRLRNRLKGVPWR